MNTKLNIVYYLLYVLAVVLVVLFGFVVDLSEVVMSPQSGAGQALQYVAIMYVLVSVPGALYGFKRYMKKVSKIEDGKQREKVYFRCAVLRMLLIGIGVLLCVTAFYLLGSYQSMLWCAAMALVAFYFCKPTEKKIYLEMNNISDSDRPTA